MQMPDSVSKIQANPPRIEDILSPERVLLDIRASDKSALLRRLAAELAPGAGLPAEEIAAAVLERETLGSTGVGNGIALPHARFAALPAPVGIFARLRQGIDFDAIDSKPVDLVFLLLLPSTGNSALAAVARTLREPATLTAIRHARDREALYSALTASPSG